MQSQTRSMDRRSFIRNSSLALSAAAAFPADLVAAPTRENSAIKFCAFEKPLTFLNHDDMAGFLAEAGYDGVEAAVRPGGRVEPEKVEDELPKLMDALKRHNLEMTILTSGINSVDQPHTEKVLRTAAKLGIKCYRMLWYRYSPDQPIFAQFEALRPVIKDLVQLNREIGISGLYQNHAGPNMVGASMWDVFMLIKDHDPKDLGLAYDLRHSQVEAGTCWPTQFSLAKSHIRAVCAKDFTWDTPAAPGTPLGKGRVDKKVIGMLGKAGFRGPYSVHVEYLNAKAGREECFKAFKEDLRTLRSWINA